MFSEEWGIDEGRVGLEILRCLQYGLLLVVLEYRSLRTLVEMVGDDTRVSLLVLLRLKGEFRGFQVHIGKGNWLGKV